MNKIYFYKLISIIILFTSCGSKKFDKGYFPDGSLKFTVKLVNGLREDTLYKYYEDGLLYLKSNWHKGKKEGATYIYYRTGKVHMIEHFKNGILDGQATIYDTLGAIQGKITYQNGVENGEYLKFYPNGKLHIQAIFKDGKRNGRMKEYFDDGKTKTLRKYAEDTIVYSVSFTQDGRFYDPFFTIMTYPEENDTIDIENNTSIEFKMLHPFYENTRIGILFGNLDSEFRLKDTIEILTSDNTSIRYNLKSHKKGHNKIEGVLHEIVDERLKAFVPFQYDYYVR